jgi:hypothetical protein
MRGQRDRDGCDVKLMECQHVVIHKPRKPPSHPIGKELSDHPGIAHPCRESRGKAVAGIHPQPRMAARQFHPDLPL